MELDVKGTSIVRVRPLTVATLLALGGLALLIALALDWRARKVAILAPGDPPAAVTAEAGPARGRTLLIWGDSRVAQWRPLPQRPYRIRAVGRPGASAVQLARLLDAELAREPADVVVIKAGVNDAVAIAMLWPAERPEARLASIAAFEAMVEASQRGGARVILMRIVPPVRPTVARRFLYRDVVVDEVARLNTALALIATRAGADLADPVALLADEGGRIPDRFRRDTLHLTAEAYRALDPLIPADLD